MSLSLVEHLTMSKLAASSRFVGVLRIRFLKHFYRDSHSGRWNLISPSERRKSRRREWKSPLELNCGQIFDASERESSRREKGYFGPVDLMLVDRGCRALLLSASRWTRNGRSDGYADYRGGVWFHCERPLWSCMSKAKSTHIFATLRYRSTQHLHYQFSWRPRGVIWKNYLSN